MENEIQPETVRQEESPAPVTAEQQEPVESVQEETAARPRPEPVPVTDEMLEKSFDAKVTIVPCIDVKIEDLVSRISGRRMCKNGHVFHVVTKPPKAEGVCDVCGEPLYQRPDDCEATVQTRLDAYEKSTAPLIDYYEQKGVLCRIDGNDEIQNVSKAMIAAIDEVM